MIHVMQALALVVLGLAGACQAHSSLRRLVA